LLCSELDDWLWDVLSELFNVSRVSRFSSLQFSLCVGNHPILPG